jgi:hypothetical protein
MAFPRPSSPATVFRDLKAFFASRKKHELLFAAASIAIPGYFVTIFLTHSVEKQYVPPEVIFVENWNAGRTIEEIRAQQKIDMAAKAERDAALEARRQKRMAQARELEKQMDALGL